MNTFNEKAITPEKAIALLKKDKILVNLEQATAIVKFLSLLAEIDLNEGSGK